MARGSFWVGLAFACGVGVALTGCQELYGGKPEKLSTPAPKKKPKEAEVEAFKDIEDCQADFRGDPKNVKQLMSQSAQSVSDGDNALSGSDKAKDPEAQGRLLQQGVDNYRTALLRDPYNAEATLKLALAYDRVYRKGCAIAMLKRLASLAGNPKFQKAATNQIDSIADNNGWFKRYRKDANAAVGR